MRSPLTTRTIALGAVVAVLVAAGFVVVASSAREARRSSDAAQRAQSVTVSAIALGELADRVAVLAADFTSLRLVFIARPF